MKKIKIFLMFFLLFGLNNLKAAEENALSKSVSLSHLKNAVADFFNDIGKVTLAELFTSKLDQKLAISGVGISLYWLYQGIPYLVEDFLRYLKGQKKCSCGQHTPLQGILNKLTVVLPLVLMLFNSYRLFKSEKIKNNKIIGWMGMAEATYMLIESLIEFKKAYYKYEEDVNKDYFYKPSIRGKLEEMKKEIPEALIPALIGGLISYRLLKHS